MKRISLAAIAVAMFFGASAQTAVVKEAERAMKDGKEAAAVVKIITPAFADPSTATMAQTWFIPGKASYSQYDHLLGLKQFNKLPENGDQLMGKLLIDGYDYFVKALPLDSVVDAKGKVKTKYSKEIVNTLVGHFADYSSAGADLYNAKDYDGAYRAWDIFCAIPEIPAAKNSLQKNGTLPADTIFGEIAFNQALAAWQAEKLENALAAFNKAKNYGYKKKQLFDYAISVATGLNNQEAILELSKEAMPLYGKEDPMYIGQIANYYLQNKQLDQAFDFINQAIAIDPTVSQYYVIQGVLYENSADANADAETKAKARQNASEAYQKAIQLDAKNAQAVYNYGRILCEEAYALSDQAPTRQDEYTEYFNTKIKPLFLKAADTLEDAYNLDTENTDILKYLENVYYNLNDEAKLNDVKKRMAY